MDHEKKLSFIHKMTKLGLDSIPHYDDGGTVVSGPQKTGGFLGIPWLGGTDIQQGTTAGQINNAYQGSQYALGRQGALTAQLEGQAPGAIDQQRQVANQLQDVISGKGPNPAQAQLNQSTGANVANQAALMAGQRGASANPALIARQVAQQGAQTQQQAAGQAATMAANQQLQAGQNLANLSANQISQAGQGVTALNQANQNEQAQILGANQAGNAANLGAQQAGNALGSSIIGGIAKGASAAFGAAKGGMVPKMAEGGITPVGGSFVGNYLSGPAPAQMPSAQPLHDISSDIEIKKKKKKDESVPDNNGEDPDAAPAESAPPPAPVNVDITGPAPGAAPFGGGDTSGMERGIGGGGGSVMLEAKGGMLKRKPLPKMAKGGKVPALVSPGEVYLSPDQVKEVLSGANPMRVGHHIPGKAKVGGDSLKNDNVHAQLEEGGIVVPRHITKHKMAPEKAMRFVHNVVKKNGMK